MVNYSPTRLFNIRRRPLRRNAPLIMATLIVLGAFFTSIYQRGVWAADHWAVFASVVLGSLSIVYLYQSQRTEETKLFKDLFSDFNERYDKLNDSLNTIRGADPALSELSDKDQAILFDYFNLCAEEYLFYKLGYINDEAWDSWLNGMQYFYVSDGIRDLWDSELGQGSYYGFSVHHLRGKSHPSVRRPPPDRA